MGIAELLKIKNEAKAKKNLEDGQAFLERNKNNPNITTLESGLQYEIILNGTENRKPLLHEIVICHYEGSLIDGTIFESTYERSIPSKFAVNKVISGWTEDLQYMDIGSQFILYIPAHLAYGNRQVGAKIPPNSTLIFKISLLEIH